MWFRPYHVSPSPCSCGRIRKHRALVRQQLAVLLRERFHDASAAQNCFGIAPVIERSGNKAWGHWRFGCSKFLRQTFVEWAGQTIPRCAWARAFYQAYIARGGRHQAALRALASSGSVSSFAAGATAYLR
jgi:hypothetical protein